MCSIRDNIRSIDSQHTTQMLQNFSWMDCEELNHKSGEGKLRFEGARNGV